MKKTFNSWKIWTLLSALIFLLTCWVFVVYATGFGSHFADTYSTGKINNTLTAPKWNDLMWDLDKLVPDWAVMAFVGRSSCPDGWMEFTKANQWRFLMWATTWFANWWWTGEIKLRDINLPSHYHNVYDYLNPVHYKSEIYNWQKLINGEYVNVGSVGWDTAVKASQTQSDGTETPYIFHKTTSVWNGVPFDIINPYVKVLYCVKWNLYIWGRDDNEQDECPFWYTDDIHNVFECSSNDGIWFSFSSTGSKLGTMMCGKCTPLDCPKRTVNGRSEDTYSCDLSAGDLNHNVYIYGFNWDNTCVKVSQCCTINAPTINCKCDTNEDCYAMDP